MIECPKKDDLIKCFIEEMVRQGIDKDLAKILVKSNIKYIPHLYKGGWVIPGYGYSVERIGKYVKKENAGDPSLVKT